ncbi:MAG: metallophosphoesterase N-terminal domain-containing protein, partial [Alistipes sp.]|uniref:metallophosphoesterase N-terminal domain-containing protein n=1 Tax=Alistipes sp. TaxID=1872444 RepID=UPI002850433E
MKTSAFILFAALLAASSLSVTGRAATRTIDLCGRVTASGRGVTGVCVTDGRTIVRTDAKGRYRLASASDAEFVYLTLPDGYEIPAEAGAAAFYRRITCL